MGESWKWGRVGEGLTIWERREKGGRALFFASVWFYEGRKEKEKKKKAKRLSFRGSPYLSRTQPHPTIPKPHPAVPNFFF